MVTNIVSAITTTDFHMGSGFPTNFHMDFDLLPSFHMDFVNPVVAGNLRKN